MHNLPSELDVSHSCARTERLWHLSLPRCCCSLCSRKAGSCHVEWNSEAHRPDRTPLKDRRSGGGIPRLVRIRRRTKAFCLQGTSIPTPHDAVVLRRGQVPRDIEDLGNRCSVCG